MRVVFFPDIHHGGSQEKETAVTITNKVRWTIDPRRSALLLHDLQPYYLDALTGENRTRIIAQARRLVVACTRRGVPVFASFVPPARRRQDRGLMFDMWGRGPAIGTDDLEPALELESAAVHLVAKRSYSAFFGNDLEVALRRHGCDSLIIAGVYTSVGCQCSAMDAFMRDIQAFLVADAMADFTEVDHRAALERAANTCAFVTDTATVCAALANLGQKPADDRIDVC